MGSLNIGGTLACDTSFTLDTVAIHATELGFIDGITAGSAGDSKALVLDADKDVGTIRNLTIDGVFTDGNYTFDTSGNVTGLGSVGCGAVTSTGIVTGTGFTAGSAVITEAELEQLDGITAGTGSASKCFVADGSGHFAMQDSKEFRLGAGNDMKLYHDGTNSYLTNAEGALKIATETSGIAVTIGHSVSEVTVADNLTVAGDLVVQGTTVTLDVTTVNVTGSFVFEGATDNAHETTLSVVDPTGDRTLELANVSGYLQPFAAASTTQISSTPEELNKLDGATVTTTEINYLDVTTLGTSEASKVLTCDSNGDFIIAGASGNIVFDKAANDLFINDGVGLCVGSGADLRLIHNGGQTYMSASAQLNVATLNSGVAISIGHTTSETTVNDNLTVTGDLTVSGGFSSSVSIASGSNGATLTKGKLTYFDEINAAASASFPQNPSVGDYFEVKHHAVGSATNKMTLSVQAGQTCDGGTELVLESPFAAVKCVYVVSGSWKIL